MSILRLFTSSHPVTPLVTHPALHSHAVGGAGVAAGLAVACLGLAWIALYAMASVGLRSHRSGSTRRMAVLLATTAWSAFYVLLLELLSLGHLVTLGPITAAFALVAIAAAMATVLWPRGRRERARATTVPSEPGTGSWVGLCIGSSAVLALTLLLVGHEYPTVNYDSLTYHLPRVMHWAQARSIGSFPTSVDRQLGYPPFAEYGILLAHLLAPDDSWFALPGWLAMLVTALATSELARRLGASTPLQAAAAALALAIPVGVFEATNGENDWTVAAWLVTFACFGWAAIDGPDRRAWSVAAGMALGLAVLTKFSAFFFAFPLLAVFALRLSYRVHDEGWRRALWLPAALVALPAVALNLPQLVRNAWLFGSPAGPTGSPASALLTPGALGSTALRNLALHFVFGASGTPAGQLSAAILGWLRLLHQLTGLSPTDARTTWALGLQDVFQATGAWTEERAGAALQVVLVLVAVGWAFSRRRRRTSTVSGDAVPTSGAFGLTPRPMVEARWLAAAVVGGFLLFSWLVRWEAGGVRLVIPLLALGSALAVASVLRTHARTAAALAIAATLWTGSWAINSSDAPLTPAAPYAWAADRTAFFSAHRELYRDYADMAALITASNCARVGMAIGDNTAEYPLWAAFDDLGAHPRIEHVGVSNRSAATGPRDFIPCAVVSQNRRDVAPVDAQEIEFVNSDDRFYLYLAPGPVVQATTIDGISSPLPVVLGTGWYPWEKITASRWMKSPARLFVHSEATVNSVVELVPRRLLPGPGRLRLDTTDGSGTADLETDTVTRVTLTLHPGWNRIILDWSAGNTVPGGVDQRQLAISWSTIRFSPGQEVAPGQPGYGA